MMGSLVSDLRYAIRALLARPGFTVTAVLTLALGIGATTAVFSVVNGLLIRDLPYADGDRLVYIWSQNPARGWTRGDIPVVDAWDYRNRTSAFEDVAVLDRRTFTLTGTDRPERLAGHGVTPNLFDVLGVMPSVGRNFVESDNDEGADPVAILSDAFWQRRFGGDPDVVGSVLQLDGVATTVVGIMPPGFPFLDYRPDLWVPFRSDPALARRGDRSNVAVARLAPGVSVDQADREVSQVALALETEQAETNQGWGAHVVLIKRDLLGDIGFTAALVIMVAVGFVLLMACTNVANLLLARANGRRFEMAIRSAMGAGRLRIVRQTLIESLVLAAIGGGIGMALSVWGTRMIVRGMPANLPPVYTFGMDGTVLAFAVLVTGATALLFGLVPALRSAEAGAGDLRDGGRSGQAARGRRFGGFLVVAQTALAAVLLIGGGVTVRSVVGMATLDPGYRADGVMTFKVSPPEARFPDRPSVTAFYDELEARLAALPGVESTGAVWNAPLVGSNTVGSFFLQGDDTSDSDAARPARLNWVAPGYFETMGVRLIRGRTMTIADDVDGPPVVIVNQTLVARHFPDEDPVGQTLVTGQETYQIIGVVADHMERSLSDPVRPAIYLPIRRVTARGRTFVVRATGDPASLVPSFREAVRLMDGDVPIYAVQSMDELVGRAVGGFTLIAQLMGGFALISLVLGAVGIYGVMAYGVGQRTNEIGIRLALGARRDQVRRMVVRQGMRRTVLGISLGLGLAVLVTQAMSALLVGVSPRDPLIYSGVTALLLAVAFLGSWLPARRAASVQPTRALAGD